MGRHPAAALYRSRAFYAAAAILHVYAVAASAPAPLAPPPLLPRRIVDNLAHAPLRVECRVRRGPLRNAVFRGVLVLDEGGEPLVRVPLPAPASGVAFGGGGYGTLYASGGDGVWAVKSNIAGAAVPSDALLKQLEKLDNAGAFRHTGW